MNKKKKKFLIIECNAQIYSIDNSCDVLLDTKGTRDHHGHEEIFWVVHSGMHSLPNSGELRTLLAVFDSGLLGEKYFSEELVFELIKNVYAMDQDDDFIPLEPQGCLCS